MLRRHVMESKMERIFEISKEISQLQAEMVNELNINAFEEQAALLSAMLGAVCSFSWKKSAEAHSVAKIGSSEILSRLSSEILGTEVPVFIYPWEKLLDSDDSFDSAMRSSRDSALAALAKMAIDRLAFNKVRTPAEEANLKRAIQDFMEAREASASELDSLAQMPACLRAAASENSEEDSRTA